MRAVKNGETSYRGLLIEHESDEKESRFRGRPVEETPQSIVIRRGFDQEKGGSLDFILETGCFSDDADTPLSPKEIEAVKEIEKSYTDAGLY